MTFVARVKPGALGLRGRWPSQVHAPRRMYSQHPAHHTSPEHPLRVAVIGSGPAGFYTTYKLMAKIQGTKVDMYESLPVPFGLVRFGVAPDHPEVKNCQEKFEEVASSPDFRFIGNVSVGTKSDHPDGLTVPLASLFRHYNAIIFAYGAAQDRKLGIPGEDQLKGVYSAREFVGWYNGLPQHANLNPDLTQGEEAVVIGQGNVALDVARMLLEDVDVLRKTDIAAHALETLSQSRVKRVHVVGRRGPMQAAFTIKEVRELMKLSNVSFHPVDTSLLPPDLKSLPRAPRRLMEMLAKGTTAISQSPSETAKSWSLDFCLTPKAFSPSSSSSTPTSTQLASTTFERTTLSPSPFDPNAYALPTGETLTLPSSIAFRSIGYKSTPLPEFSDINIPFDERRGIISNDGRGRVQHEERTRGAEMSHGSFPGLYCAGWVKTGPTGVIASTMENAFATADAIIEDWVSRTPFLNADRNVHGWEGVKSEVLKSGDDKRVVDWQGWRRIDEAERDRGRETGRSREKFTRTGEMLNVLG
ncbi:nucleotide-binding domain-containing protein [Neurospora crassa]|uniref:NADPH:adrenodoxin oxidoreductase, mitochondrial n=1 Tax=Neurospora crassa (strain ATCC 24698 / 74-OR23-1A / CBS 708.71 / DSM 1257 / FGSC 987) TaxID=367110 RepID=Q7SAN6_NEUCR|nr:NADPH-adrenodoxin reductase Arh1 [Neurospora crassa OR74A]EAA33439.2 NADPH-adrenodoxin reductase Arh1 [Neurospora crassa OR74A]KHE84429.1 nucleotide-binding domain-containing protein [Neurospora crassa]|eukprot:XP_962675.2 NADPH-adrenodoxin reductase Arh1 [Neurospora crassa OR74A]